MADIRDQIDTSSREQRLAFATVRELGYLLRSGETTPMELAELFHGRLEHLGPRLNAVVTVTRERALTEAAEATAELAAGHDRGPLHGIPYGAKDLLATGGGIPTTWGAAPFREQRFAEDAAVLVRLREAGAVLVAKLAMVELAGGFGYDQPDASFTGPGINPWDVARWSGGSSSGSGSAVAAGLVPFALGSETWGSIMTPAAYCGLSGLRPTFGRVSTRGAMALSWSLDKLGPMCRSADDCGLVLQAIAGPDPADRFDQAPSWRYWPSEPPGGFRLAVPAGLDKDEVVQPATRANFQRALDLLRPVATIEEVPLPEFPYGEVTRTILNCEMASAFEEFLAEGGPRGLTAPEDRSGGYAGTSIPAVAYLRALRLRGRIVPAIEALLSRFDAIVAPLVGDVASRLDRTFSSGRRGGDGRTVVAAIGAAGNVAGLPALSVPSGFDAGGLPTAIAFVGGAGGEQRLLDVGRAYQRLSDWHRRHPEW